MSTGSRKDPLTVFSFKLDIKTKDNFALASPLSALFKTVSGLSVQMNTADYKEGGQNMFLHTLMGDLKWSDLVLKNGFSGDLRWLTTMWLSADAENPPSQQRVAGDITWYDHKNPRITIGFDHGIICKWELGELDGSKNELMIQSITIKHSGLFIAKAT